MHCSTIRLLCCQLFVLVACNTAVAQESPLLQGPERITVAQGFDLRGFAQVGASDRLDLEATQQKSASDQSTPAKPEDKLNTDSQLKSETVKEKEPSDDSKKGESKEKDESKASDKDKTKDKEKGKEKDKSSEPKKKQWYEKISLRGYGQFRYNYPTFTEDGSAPRQHAGDASISERQEFFIRRARLIFFGDISDHLYLYVQPDLASTPNGSVDQIQFAQIRDFYGDVYVDKEKVHRFRIGQSKIPYGWENLQSSANRLTLDRNDAFNSAARNERDLGVFYYYTPKWGQELFKYISDNDLKGSGNYGIFGLGFYDGQGGSLREQNDSQHLIARLTIPFCMNNQLWEVSMQGFSGDYVVLGERIQPLGVGAAAAPAGTRDLGGAQGLLDQRFGWTLIKYPQPFGVQAEYTIGRGPQLNAAQTALEVDDLHGGYVMANYRYKSDNHGEFWPFLRYQYYRGGYRSSANAPYAEIDEWNIGVEWQMKKEFELVTEYLITDRTNLQAFSSGRSYGQYNGHLLRFQFQINF